jgi:pantothenate kinase type III
MLSGCVVGTAGAVDRLVGSVRREMNLPECEAILTGGNSDLLYDHLQTAVRREPALVLQGLVASYLTQ